MGHVQEEPALPSRLLHEPEEDQIVIDQILDGDLQAPTVFCAHRLSLEGHRSPLNIGVDYLEEQGHDLVHRLATISPSENREAQRLMDDTRGYLLGLVHPLLAHLTNEWTPTHPLLGVTGEPTIIDTPIDTLIKQMIGWRTHEVPGGWTLSIPPRSTPENWTERNGLIRPQFSVDPMSGFDRNLMFCGWFGDPRPVAYYEEIGFPRWLIEERERMHRIKEDQTFMGMIEASDGRIQFEDEYLPQPIAQCPDGHRRTGGNHIGKEVG